MDDESATFHKINIRPSLRLFMYSCLHEIDPVIRTIRLQQISTYYNVSNYKIKTSKKSINVHMEIPVFGERIL